MGKRTTGVVRAYDASKGYGYIDSEDGQQVFVHTSALDRNGPALLSPGERVIFFLENTVRGFEAADVTRQN